MIAVGSRENCDALCDAHSTVFPTNNLGLRSWYTGCAFERDRKQGTVQISQTAYVDQLCERFDVFSSSPLPAAPQEKIFPRQENEATRSDRYRELIGVLRWVANMTSPDISNAIRARARFSHDPSEVHWHGALKILRYLRGTRTLGIMYRKGMGQELYVFADLSHAGDFYDRRSVSGGAMIFGRAAVSWFSKTQRTVALSTSEAEYMAMGESDKELLFVRNVLYFMQPKYGVPSVYVLEITVVQLTLLKTP
ncbi:unnamed protein product [Discosporangium mesarthrocarpum]